MSLRHDGKSGGGDFDFGLDFDVTGGLASGFKEGLGAGLGAWPAEDRRCLGRVTAFIFSLADFTF